MGVLFEMARCTHKDKSGNSVIVDGECQICGEVFGANFLNKQRNKKKRRKKNGVREVVI